MNNTCAVIAYCRLVVEFSVKKNKIAATDIFFATEI